MEVLLAVIVMGSALAILLGLQGSLIDQTLRDRYQQDAMLLARRILAAVETGEIDPQVVEETVNAEELLSDFLELDDNRDNQPTNLKEYEVFLSIAPVGLPEIDEAMKQIVLRVYHRSIQRHVLEVTYFIPFAGDANSN